MAFPVQEDDHLYTVLHFVERNAPRADLVQRAENWRWSSLCHRGAAALDRVQSHRHRWPLPFLEDWLVGVYRAEREADLQAVCRSIERHQPFGSEHWQKSTAKGLGLEYILRQPVSEGKTPRRWWALF